MVWEGADVLCLVVCRDGHVVRKGDRWKERKL